MKIASPEWHAKCEAEMELPSGFNPEISVRMYKSRAKAKRAVHAMMQGGWTVFRPKGRRKIGTTEIVHRETKNQKVKITKERWRYVIFYRG